MPSLNFLHVAGLVIEEITEDGLTNSSISNARSKADSSFPKAKETIGSTKVPAGGRVSSPPSNSNKIWHVTGA